MKQRYLEKRQLHNLHSSPSVIWAVDLKERDGRTVHVAHMTEMRNAYKILVLEPGTSYFQIFLTPV
jgi:hypothetical protein